MNEAGDVVICEIGKTFDEADYYAWLEIARVSANIGDRRAGFFVERDTRLELATFGLGSQRSTN